MHLHRVRWAAIGAAVAITLGAGGLGIVNATISTGSRSVFVPITPCRLVDTRPAPATVGTRSTPLQPGEIAVFVVHGSNGNCTIPPGATSISGNVTITAPTSDGFLSVSPADAPLPNASNLNWSAGQAPTPNAVIVDLSSDGKINVFNERGTVNVIVDIVGYYEDHDHDDRYYTKSQSDTQLTAKSNVSDVYTKTQSDAQLTAKANAADVYTKAQINGMPSSSVVAGGAVAANGTIMTLIPRFGSAWTVSKPFTGVYQVAMPGLNPGCQNPLLPLVLVSAAELSPGFQQGIAFGGVNCGNGDTTVQINTYSAASTPAAVDRAFQFVAYRPGNNQLLPATVPSDHPGATECTVHLDGAIECV